MSRYRSLFVGAMFVGALTFVAGSTTHGQVGAGLRQLWMLLARSVRHVHDSSLRSTWPPP